MDRRTRRPHRLFQKINPTPASIDRLMHGAMRLALDLIGRMTVRRERRMKPGMNGARAARARIEDFGPVPTARQQMMVLATAASAMIIISATMAYLGLI
jgi:hypothetical protein